jgi:hypothetical protein
MFWRGVAKTVETCRVCSEIYEELRRVLSDDIARQVFECLHCSSYQTHSCTYNIREETGEAMENHTMRFYKEYFQFKHDDDDHPHTSRTFSLVTPVVHAGDYW